MDTLKSQPAGSWSPAVSLPSLLLSLRVLLGEPNADDGLVADVTAQFKNDYQGWFLEAKQMTEMEATDAQLVAREEGIKESMNVDEVDPKEMKPRIFVRKDKENRERSVNVMDEDASGNVAFATGKRKGSEVDFLRNERDDKFRRTG